MIRDLKTAAMLLLIMTLFTGLAYPLAITGIAQLVFPHQSNGSLLTRHGMVVGSELIGQPFDDPKYFWSRPSATGPVPYNGASSSGSNMAVSNPAQAEAIAMRIRKLRDSGVSPNTAIPVDLVTASGSGLDPHISRRAAAIQIARIARARGLDETKVRELVEKRTEGRQFGFLGEERINVLQLNLALDDLQNAQNRSDTR